MDIEGHDLQEILEKVVELALDAGKEIMDIYTSSKKVDVEMKVDSDGVSSPLTQADLRANTIIVNGLQKLFPEHGILTEESYDTKERLSKNFVWIIDPLDGTKEFVRRNDEFTVNIALSFTGEPILGVIYVPAKETLYYAVKGEGAFRKKNETVKKITVSSHTALSEMAILKSRSHAKPLFTQFITNHPFGFVKECGSSLKGCLVADSVADVYCRFGHTCEWDICAMHIILEEAGGALTTLEGEKITYNNENTLKYGFIASNGRIHEKLVGWCREVNV